MIDKKPADGQKVLKEKVDEYKKAHPERLPEVDFAFVLKSLEKLNESSRVKVARNAINEKREWIPGTQVRNVSSVYLSDDHCITFKLSMGDKEMLVGELLDDLAKIQKKFPMKNIPVMVELSEENRVQITDVYAHSLVSDKWAGLPIDFVLCFTEKAAAKKHVETPSEE